MKNPILRLISKNHDLFLPKVDGNLTINSQNNIFSSVVGSNMSQNVSNHQGVFMPETPIQIFELIHNSQLIDIFEYLPGNWNQKWLSQNQLIIYCEKYPYWIREKGQGTLILMKINENEAIPYNNPQDNLMVAGIYKHGVGFGISIIELNLDFVWNAEEHYRVVMPKIII